MIPIISSKRYVKLSKRGHSGLSVQEKMGVRDFDRDFENLKGRHSDHFIMIPFAIDLASSSVKLPGIKARPLVYSFTIGKTEKALPSSITTK
jgi:hypothetical protein